MVLCVCDDPRFHELLVYYGPSKLGSLRTPYFVMFGTPVCRVAAGVRSSQSAAMAAFRPAASRSSWFPTPPTPNGARCFPVTAPPGPPFDAAMVPSALGEIMGRGGLLYLRHYGGSRFGAAASSIPAAGGVVAWGGLQLGGRTAAL